MARAMARMKRRRTRIRTRRSKGHPVRAAACNAAAQTTGPRDERAPFPRTVPHASAPQHGVPQRVRDDAAGCYCSLTETLSLAPVASITEIRMKPFPGGSHCVSRRRCGSVTGAPSTSQV